MTSTADPHTPWPPHGWRVVMRAARRNARRQGVRQRVFSGRDNDGRRFWTFEEVPGAPAESAWSRRHPLCICPELTFTQMLSGPKPDIDACRAQSGGLTHKILTPDEARASLASLIKPPGQERPPDG